MTPWFRGYPPHVVPATLCITLTKTKVIHECRFSEQVPEPVFSFQQPVRLKATNNVRGEHLTVQLSCLYAVRHPCCWHAVWLLSFFPLDLSPPGYGWVRVRSLPGPKDRTPDAVRKIGHRMDPIRPQHRGRSLFTACCWHAVWLLSFFPLDLSPPGYGWVRVRSLPGPKDGTPDGPYSTTTSRPVALHRNGI